MCPWQRAFAPDTWPNWALVIVGLGAIGTAWFTLLAIRDQTNALVESQRPKIAAKPHGNPTHDLADLNSPRIQLELFNRGLSVAQNLTYESWIELLPLPFRDFTAAADYHKSEEPMALYPSHDPIIINVPVRKGISEQQLSELRRLETFACVRLRVYYGDAFSAARVASFGFWVAHNGLGFLPKYNDAG
jgi:hypothetical protein